MRLSAPPSAIAISLAHSTSEGTVLMHDESQEQVGAADVMLSISAVSASAIKNNAKSEVRHPNFARGGTAQSVALAG